MTGVSASGSAAGDTRQASLRGLRLLLLLESSGPGGAERVVLHLAAALRVRGVEPSVATFRPGWMTQRARELGLPVWIVPQRHGLDPLWSLRLARRLRTSGIALLHTHEFAANVYGAVAARLARIPQLATVHGRSWVGDRRRRALAYRLLPRLGTPFAAVSADLADFLATEIGVARSGIRVVANGVPIPARAGSALSAAEKGRVRQRLGLPERGHLVVSVGNLYPVKDHATLIRAAARSRLELRVAIAGRGAEAARLRALAETLGIAPRVHLLGLRDDIAELLAAADLFALPSRSEGLPMALLEAMAAGLPVVATAVGGVPEALEGGRCGRLVRPGDPEALAAAIDELAMDRAQAIRLGAAARARAQGVYSDRAMAERYEWLYAELLSRARPR